MYPNLEIIKYTTTSSAAVQQDEQIPQLLLNIPKHLDSCNINYLDCEKNGHFIIFFLFNIEYCSIEQRSIKDN
jgi:hypothetical protein